MSKKILSVLVSSIVLLYGVGCSRHNEKIGLNVNLEPPVPIVDDVTGNQNSNSNSDLPKPAVDDVSDQSSDAKPESDNSVIEKKEEAREVEKPKVPEKEDLPQPTRPTRPTQWHIGYNLTPLQVAENSLFNCYAWADYIQELISENQGWGYLDKVESFKKELEKVQGEIREAEDRILELQAQPAAANQAPPPLSNKERAKLVEETRRKFFGPELSPAPIPTAIPGVAPTPKPEPSKVVVDKKEEAKGNESEEVVEKDKSTEVGAKSKSDKDKPEEEKKPDTAQAPVNPQNNNRRMPLAAKLAIGVEFGVGLIATIYMIYGTFYGVPVGNL